MCHRVNRANADSSVSVGRAVSVLQRDCGRGCQGVARGEVHALERPQVLDAVKNFGVAHDRLYVRIRLHITAAAAAHDCTNTGLHTVAGAGAAAWPKVKVATSRRSGHDGAVSSHHHTLGVCHGLKLRECLVQRLLHTTTELSAMIDDRQWLQVLVHHLVQLIIA